MFKDRIQYAANQISCGDPDNFDMKDYKLSLVLDQEGPGVRGMARLCTNGRPHEP